LKILTRTGIDDYPPKPERIETMFSIEDIIELAIQIEQNGKAVCCNALKKNIDPSLADLFAWMADEEQKHIQWLEGLKKTTQLKEQDPQLEKMGRELLHDVLGKQSFSLGEIDFSQVKQVKDLIALLIDFEKDTVLFYEMIRAVVSDSETLKYLDMIIKEERQHQQKLQAYLEKKRIVP
jgi:rubrerythrin